MQYREGWLRGRKDVKLYYQAWLPETKARAAVVIVHGLAEHGGRYQNLVDHLIPRGYASFAFDLRGHGHSEGRRCYVERFADYTEDLNTFVKLVQSEHPGVPVFLFGHSMGGTIALAYAVNRWRNLAGMILSAPVMKPGADVSPFRIRLARLCSRWLPAVRLGRLEAAGVSRDPEVVKSYCDDPLVYCGRICARLGAELIEAMDKFIPPKLWKIEVPVLIMYGSADRLVDPASSLMLFEKLGGTDKTLKKYEGLYHEIINEPDREQVLADIERWLSARV